MKKTLYHMEEDSYFSHPYIDVEEWREKPVHHYYVHGGFRGTDNDGMPEARFCFYFPEKEKYEGRFFQYVSPAPEDEHESEHLAGEDDKISFALTHGAYYVVSNQGGFVLNDLTGRLYRTSANTAEFSRTVAKRIYQTEKRPYGYIYGGSGGSFKTIGCVEATEGIWDGSVPYVMANPMAAPNVFAPRMRAVRLLGEKGMQHIVDALEPGGSGDIYEGLNEDQKQALAEATKMGFPPKAWFMYPYMGDGALMILVPTVYELFPDYFRDFWEKEGYEGADPDSNEYKSRMQHVTTVKEISYEQEEKQITEEEYTSVNNSWVNGLLGGEQLPKIKMKDRVPEGAYQYHCRFRVLDGDAAGAEINIEEINGKWLILHPDNEGVNNKNPFKKLKVGDRIMVDNSDAIAMQCFHRHQVPDTTYEVYNQFRNSEGKPMYAQLPMLLAESFAVGGAGLLINGNMHGKMIGVCSLMDESACPWHGDWYRKAIRRNGVDEEKQFRLYYHDNSVHDDRAGYLDDPQRQVDYLGTLHQALMDLAAWCEEGKEPLATTNYRYEDGQISVPAHAKERGGMQPVVFAYANGEKAVQAAAGEPVSFTAVIEVPENAGKVTQAAWDFEKTNDWSAEEELEEQKDGTVLVKTTHVFTKPGTYYPCIKVQSNRRGDKNDIFTQCKNLDRVRVDIVE